MQRERIVQPLLFGDSEAGCLPPPEWRRRRGEQRPLASSRSARQGLLPSPVSRRGVASPPGPAPPLRPPERTWPGTGR